MIFYDKNFNPTSGYMRWQAFINRNVEYKNLLEHTKILLIFLRDYIEMHNNGTLLEYNNKALSLGIDFIMLEDPHNYPAVPDFVKDSPIKTFILHNDFTIDNQVEAHRLYWPVWLFFVQDKTEQVSDIVPRYQLSCASRNMCYRPGKIYNYQLIKSKSYFDKILFTKFKIEPELDCHWPRPDDAEFEEVFQKLAIDYLDWPNIDNNLFDAMAALNIPVYTESLFHLVAESGVRENLISEKTYKIFHVKQIPILCGARNTIAHLRNIGFDVFDDLVDHRRYDSIADFKRRIDEMHSVIEPIFYYDNEQLVKATEVRRNNNYNWLHSDELTDLIAKPLLDRLAANM